MRRSTFAIPVVVLCMFSSLGSGQTEASSAYTYDVVSERPNKGDAHGISSSRASLHSDVALSILIRFAFDVRLPEQISGIPHWADSAQYVVQAKVDEKSIAAMAKLSFQDQIAQRRQMCIAMLEDRFGLKFHNENKQVPVYELVIAKSGPKLKKSSAQGSHSSMVGGALTGTGMTITEIAERLSGPAGRMIVDKTGLEGRFDVGMNWAVEDDPESDDPRPSLFTAIVEQMGLRLAPSKATMNTVVIDALTQPSEN